jgi:hypothetical protein
MYLNVYVYSVATVKRNFRMFEEWKLFFLQNITLIIVLNISDWSQLDPASMCLFTFYANIHFI